jgi:hypothetical protein
VLARIIKRGNQVMEFGVFILAQQRSYDQTSKQVLDCAVQQTVAAEAAGFDTAWYAEHHFNNYSLSPSPLMLVTYCAALTKTIRLGTAVCVLPLYHPNRLLGEIGSPTTCRRGGWNSASGRDINSSNSSGSV